MTRQLRARLIVLSLSIKKVCLRQYHFSTEGMRKGFLFCQRKGLDSRGENPPPPQWPPPEKRPAWQAFEREGKGSYPNSGVNKELDVIVIHDYFYSIYDEQRRKTHLFP